MATAQLTYSVVTIDDQPHCFWDPELTQHNRDFLNGILPEYFEFLVEAHAAADETKAQMAALALRSAYHQALETFVALACTALQAPGCAIGWMLLYRDDALRSLVRRINSSQGGVPNQLGLSRVTWQGLAEVVHHGVGTGDADWAGAVQCFGQVWQRFGVDYCEHFRIAEYNSVKHGLRARPGGWWLAVGLEKERGVPAPPEAMQCIGRSDYGTHFHCAEPVRGPDGSAQRGHWFLERRRLNWDVEHMATAIQLLAMSQTNLLSFLKRHAGIPAKDLKFFCPVDERAFDLPGGFAGGANNFAMRMTIPSQVIPAWDKRKLQQIYSAVSLQRTSQDDQPGASEPAAT